MAMVILVLPWLMRVIPLPLVKLWRQRGGIPNISPWAVDRIFGSEQQFLVARFTQQSALG